MKTLTILAFIVFACVSARGGIVLTIENDFITHSDDSYSHGTELEWVDDARLVTSGDTRVGYGVHQLMYTPTNIHNPNNQPNDRPWCGILAAFRETWSRQGEPGNAWAEVVRTRIEAGVMGPAAMSEQSQTVIHKIVGSGKPEGWDNQMPDEPVVNLYQERHHPLQEYGRANGFGSHLEAVYGGTVGTTFINGLGGVLFRSGWNVQAYNITGGIEPKGISGIHKSFLYATLETDGMLVLHNATLGESFFRNREAGHEQDLEHGVGMYRYGIVAGYGSLAATYLIGERTREYKAQTKNTDWGLISLAYTSQF